MTDTTIATAIRVKQFDDKHHAEYVRANRYKPFMGSSDNSLFQVKENLTKQKGDAITIPLVGALDASAGPNDGSTALVGNELALPNDGHKITVGLVRNATSVVVEEEQASPIDIRKAGQSALKDLQMRYLRNDINTALGSINGVAYASATAGQKNTWHDGNSDRIVYGGEVSNFVASDHAASLATVAGTDKLTAEVVSLYKRVAQTATNVNGDGIRPYKYGQDMESYVMFVNSLAFRDLRKDLITNGYWQDAMARSKENPLFSGPTSIEWDGVLVREIPEIASISGVGAGSIDVAPVYLCGAQALGLAWAKRTKTTLRTETDYENTYGVGFMELRGVEKLQYGQGTAAAKDWSVMTGFVAGVADA